MLKKSRVRGIVCVAKSVMFVVQNKKRVLFNGKVCVIR